MTDEPTTTERPHRIFHPLLLAIYPGLAFFAENISELSLNFLFYPTLFSVAGAALLWFLLALITKDKMKSAILTSLFVLLFFSYGHLAQEMVKAFIPHPHKILLTLTLGTFFLCLYFIRKSKRNFNRATVFLNIMAAVLLLLPVLNKPDDFYLKLSYFFGKVERPSAGTVAVKTDPKKSSDLPDIYYFISDRYAGTQTLKEVYNFDNTPFINKLKDKGFMIASRSIANYPHTELSLSSSLNMCYLDFLSKQKGAKANDYSVVMEMLSNNEVLKFVRGHGYKYYHLGMNWDPYKVNPKADVNINYSVEPERVTKFLETTMLDPFITLFVGKSKREGKRDYLRYQYAQVMKLASEPGPKFVFAHIGTTHPEFLFGHKGDPVSGEEVNRDESKAYLDTIRYHNQRMEEVITTLLTKSAKPPVIILQSDEGPYWPSQKIFIEKGSFPGADEQSLKIRCRIFNSYYLPGIKDLPPEDISPVNTFRFIFNSYFKTDMPILPNECYIPGAPTTPFQFRKVTDIVRYQDTKQ